MMVWGRGQVGFVGDSRQVDLMLITRSEVILGLQEQFSLGS